MSQRYKYITIKQNEQLYRVLHFEEATDGSIYVSRPLFAKSRSSYHSNNGQFNPPFRTHQYGCNGKKILDSIENRTKFITDYSSSFLKMVITRLPATGCIETSSENDVVINIDSCSIEKYEIVCFSDKRNDLLNHEFDNAIVKGVPLKSIQLVVGCFERPRK